MVAVCKSSSHGRQLCTVPLQALYDRGVELSYAKTRGYIKVSESIENVHSLEVVHGVLGAVLYATGHHAFVFDIATLFSSNKIR